ncbi:MAG TPA: TIM barrel protein [Dehalococcoidales bacterium]|nr:TIM barrel protein [Dehalococcoidales bacterium]
MPQIFLSHHPQFSPLSEITALCQKHSFGIELAAFSDLDAVKDLSQPGFHTGQITHIRERAIHGPYLGLYPGSPDAEMRRRTMECFKRVYQIALAVQARHIIFHHNYNPADGSPAQWLKYSRQFWRTYLEAKSGGIRIHLENVLDDAPTLLLEVIEQIGHPDLDAALDIGHVQAYSKTPCLEWIAVSNSVTGYVHLHDNHGLEDEHLALGSGTAPLPQILNSLRRWAPGAVWSIESGGSKMYQSVQWLSENGFLD